MSRLLFLLLLVALAGQVSAARAQAHNYLPLEPGNEAWYTHAPTTTLTMHVLITGYQQGASVQVTEYLPSGGQAYRLLTANGEGDVFELGTGDPAGGWYLWDVPIKIIDAPLYVGKTWTYDVQCCDMFGNCHNPSLTYVVEAEEDLNVPAGLFHCFRVRPLYACTTVPNQEVSWYAEGVGLVRHIGSGFGPWGAPDYQLSAVTVPVEQVTWGRLKSVYR